MSDNNVIDIRTKQKKESDLNFEPQAKTGDLVDITERRQEAIRSERRDAKRTVLTQFMGAFVVLPQRGLQKVDLYDISNTGLSFDLPFESGKLNIGEEVAVRFYISQNTYFPFRIKITNTRHIADEGVYRHGSSFIEEKANKEPLKHLVNFIESVSVALHEDRGDMKYSSRS